MISRSEHMINAMIQRMEELREGKYGPVEELSHHQLIVHIFDVAKCYTVDRREILNLLGMTNLSAQEIETIAKLDYEDNSR